LLITAHTGRRVDLFDTAAGQIVQSVELEQEPHGAAYSRVDGSVYIAVGIDDGYVVKADVATGRIKKRLTVGHGPVAPVVSPDGTFLYVALRFDNAVAIVDLERFTLRKTIDVSREPVALALSPDERFLYVANHMPTGRSDVAYVSACVSVIDTKSGTLAASVKLPNGSEGLRGLCVSADGGYVFVSHLLARHQVPTTQVERGWMNTAALTIIATADQSRVATILLDDVTLGFANPWAVAVTPDGKRLLVSSAGTHEIREIDLPALFAKLKVRDGALAQKATRVIETENDLVFVAGISQRISLAGNGPRAMALVGDDLYVAEYFSDTLSKVDLADPLRTVKKIELGPQLNLSPERKGEMFFNDAALCFQKWQSCASCHSEKGRTDGLNWDLLNDGMGNPKNAKSLLYSHRTPPVMALGVRADAETAVRAGIKYIQFAVRPEEDAAAIDAYLKTLKPVPSPHLVDGQLSDAAQRGEAIYQEAGCAACHPPPYYTDMKLHDVGTGKGLDQGKAFDVPGLIEAWRTAPYLYDGRAQTIFDVFKMYNPDDRHGRTSHLSDDELMDLAAYVESL
jgi:DNA-binding beta-propeller fold protein YncE